MLISRCTSRVSSFLFQSKRELCQKNTTVLEISANFVNRNPRNLERMRIGYKPDGYHVEKPGRNFWHKLELQETGRYVKATVQHFQSGKVLEASTSEWAIKKHLYKGKDTSAYYNLGKVLAERCLRTGLNEISCDLVQSSTSKEKITHFLNAMRQQGVVLEESPQFKPSRPWDLLRPEKPWEVHE